MSYKNKEKKLIAIVELRYSIVDKILNVIDFTILFSATLFQYSNTKPGKKAEKKGCRRESSPGKSILSKKEMNFSQSYEIV